MSTTTFSSRAAEAGLAYRASLYELRVATTCVFMAVAVHPMVVVRVPTHTSDHVVSITWRVLLYSVECRKWISPLGPSRKVWLVNIVRPPRSRERGGGGGGIDGCCHQMPQSADLKGLRMMRRADDIAWEQS